MKILAAKNRNIVPDYQETTVKLRPVQKTCSSDVKEPAVKMHKELQKCFEVKTEKV